MDIDKKILKNNSLFRDMSDEDIDSIIDSMNGRIINFEKSCIMKNEGDSLDDIGIVLSGEIYAQRSDENGNNCLMEIFMPGDSFGEMNSVGGYPVNVSLIAKEKSSVLFLSAEKLFNEYDDISQLTAKYLCNLSFSLAQKAKYFSEKLEDRIHRSTRQRITDYLSEQYHINERREFTIPLDRQDLADYLFVDRSAMSKELGKMKEEGLIEFDKADFKLMVSMPISDKK